MTIDSGEQELGGSKPQEASPDDGSRAKIEQRLEALFHLAGDSYSARQLKRMVIEYRLGQRS